MNYFNRALRRAIYLEWKDQVAELDRLEAVAKDDVVAWANEFLGADSYVAVYKRIGEDTTVSKISAPAITPIESNRDKQVFEKVQNMTLEDVKATQQKWIKDREYTYMILGDIQDLDLNFLKTLGPVKTVSLEEIFGY